MEWNFLLSRQKQSKGSKSSTYPLCLPSFWAQEANPKHGYSIQAAAVQVTKVSRIGFPTMIIFYRKKYTLEIRKLRWSIYILLPVPCFCSDGVDIFCKRCKI